MQIEGELIFKLCLFCVGLASHYFLLKNSINIIAERQNVDHLAIKETAVCLDKYRERFNEAEAKLAVIAVRINNIEDDMETICKRVDCHIDKP